MSNNDGVFSQSWYIVGQPWGDGTWIVAGNPNPHLGQFVCHCDGMDPDEPAEEARARAAWIVALRNEWKFRKEMLLTELGQKDRQIQAMGDEIIRLRGERSLLHQELAGLPGWYRRLGIAVFNRWRAANGWRRRVISSFK